MYGTRKWGLIRVNTVTLALFLTRALLFFYNTSYWEGGGAIFVLLSYLCKNRSDLQISSQVRVICKFQAELFFVLKLFIVIYIPLPK